MTKRIIFLFGLYIIANSVVFSQVKIGDNPSTINSNSILELESTSKGFTMPRVALTGVNSVSPLADYVLEGTIVYNSGSTLAKGFYYWDGSRWVRISNSASNPTSKTASATLTKNETFVLVNPATTSATITLPQITEIDNGLEITVKNVGSYDDLVTVVGYSGADIDGAEQYHESRWVGMTFTANDGSWITRRKENIPDNIMDVNSEGSWTTIAEAIAYLEEHMTQPVVIRLGDEEYIIDETVIIDLPYALTFQGLSYGTTTIVPDTAALDNKPMFRCKSDCNFKMLAFEDGGGADDYFEDAIHFLGAGTYNEIKDCTFDGFYSTVIDSSSAEIWVFETDFSNASANGILLHSATAGAILKVAETDFIDCARGVNLDKGSSTTIQLASGGYYNGTGDSAITYHPYTFSFSTLSITGNSWNNTGSYIYGFDFTRSDGRDKNAILESNAGMADQKPSCYIRIDNNTTNTSLTATNTWYKLNWDYTKYTSSPTKWTITNATGGVSNVNRITYQPSNRRNVIIHISGNIQSSSSSAIVNIGVVKNPSTTNSTSITRYGETTLRPGVANQAVQFSTVIYLTDVAPNDYFELWANSTTSGITVTIQDSQWFINTQ